MNLRKVHFAPDLVPQGHARIAQGFNLGEPCGTRPSPGGTAEPPAWTFDICPRIWSLELGASLELGVWSLEFAPRLELAVWCLVFVHTYLVRIRVRIHAPAAKAATMPTAPGTQPHAWVDINETAQSGRVTAANRPK